MNGHVAAILLAAGKSQRMGSCKQLLPLGNRRVIDCCLETLTAAGINEIVVVVSRNAEEVAEAARIYPVKIVVNTHIDGDMASSVRVGRNALLPDSTGVIVTLCDYPLLLPSTLSLLMAKHQVSPESIIIPCHAGQRGHPLLFPRQVLNGLADEQILRDLVHHGQAKIIHLDVEDSGVLIDMDTPEDYRRILELTELSRD